MEKLKPKLLLLLAVPFLMVMVGVTLQTPAPVNAGPLAGFTPTPSSPDDGGPDNDPGPAPEQYEDEEATRHGSDGPDEITAQIEPCELDATMSFSPFQSSSQALASISDDSVGLINFDLIQQQPAVELLAEVNLVHQGSGFIVSGTLSDQYSTHFPVPYAGQWQVLMMAPPKLNGDGLIDASGLNLAQIHAEVAKGPIPLGVVQANIAGAQLVDCPVIPIRALPGPAPEDTSYLPTTGAELHPVEAPAPLTSAILLVANGWLILTMLIGGYRGLKK